MPVMTTPNMIIRANRPIKTIKIMAGTVMTIQIMTTMTIRGTTIMITTGMADIPITNTIWPW